MNTTTISFKTTFSKRMIAVAIIGIAIIGVPTPMTASAASDACSARPAGAWLPPQVEMEFAARCSSGSSKLASPNHGYCSAAIAKRSWLPPQVERQFAEWCK